MIWKQCSSCWGPSAHCEGELMTNFLQLLKLAHNSLKVDWRSVMVERYNDQGKNKQGVSRSVWTPCSRRYTYTDVGSLTWRKKKVPCVRFRTQKPEQTQKLQTKKRSWWVDSWEQVEKFWTRRSLNPFKVTTISSTAHTKKGLEFHSSALPLTHTSLLFYYRDTKHADKNELNGDGRIIRKIWKCQMKKDVMEKRNNAVESYGNGTRKHKKEKKNSHQT